GGADAIPAGKVVNGYRIERLLGCGGMAVVYQATQLSLSRPVALKTLPRHLAANPAFVARFNREAGALASLSHPNIIGIIDRGSEGDLYYFVMEFVDGTDLQAQIAKARPAPGEAVRIATQVLSALEYAHKRGVIHRDIKPGNIMLTSDGAVKVTDFGIAHLAGGQGTAIGLTMAGAQMGTVNYMAPEQRVDAGKVDARADLYAAGVVLYEMLTGQLPLGAFEPASAVNSAVDPRLDAVILKALKRDPEARWKSASEMAAALAPLAGAAPPPHEPRAAAPAMAACPFCKSENRADAKFCLNCGKTLHETCPKCSKPMRAQSKFCDSCGTNVSEWAAQAKAEAERRFAAAGRLEKEGKLAEALAELAAVLAAEGKELDGLRAKAKEQRDRVQAAKDAQDNAFRGGQTLYDAKDYERAIAAWEKLPAGLPHVKDGIAEARKKIEARDRAVADADAAFAAGRWDDAMAAFERAAALVANPAPLKPKMDAVRAKVGEARYAAAAQKAGQATDPAAAIAAWNEALKWKPGDAAATEGLRRAEGQKRQSDRGAFAAKGDQASGAGRKREAVEAWERALALCGPEDAALRGELEGKLRSAKAALAAERQKLVVIGAIGGGVLLFLALAVAILVAIVGKGCDGSSSGSGGGGGGGGGTAPAPAGPTVYSTPESLFDAFKAAIAAGDFDKAYDMNSRQAKAQVTRAAFEQQVKQTFQPWNPGGLNAGHMRRTNSQTYGDTAEVYWQYPVEGQYFDSPQPSVMIREDGGWKFQ
ncbi:MAG: protein kinase, partial [Planctomycetia bacterium]|nr:protein kinase [Planctomycetia bacterium]